MDEFLKVIQPALFELLSVIGAYVLLRVAQYVKARTTVQQRDQVINIIEASVNYVEQVTGERLASEEKFEVAKQRALDSINSLGFSMDERELEMWIENFVKKLEENK